MSFTNATGSKVVTLEVGDRRLTAVSTAYAAIARFLGPGHWSNAIPDGERMYGVLSDEGQALMAAYEPALGADCPHDWEYADLIRVDRRGVFIGRSPIVGGVGHAKWTRVG